MAEVEEKAVAEVEVVEVGAEVPAVAAEHQDDVYDGLYREVVSREVAHREGRQEGRSLIVEMPEGEGEPDYISYGQREMIDAFDKRLDKEKVQHRGIEVGRFPAGDAEKVGQVKDMVIRQTSDATKRRKELERWLGLPALPEVIESDLERIEGKLPALPGSEVNNEGGSEDGNEAGE
ncbi:unnamed protein product [marine sediment metagenome]|uniref:Uncharacterized protein n=1 Tax=marine sediment metagenome TaxID=412755 RepID=X1QEK2_9ZZZZ